MPKPKVTVLNQPKKINPIEREVDNTMVLEHKEFAATHSGAKKFQMPANYDNSKNGTVTTAPPMPT